MTLHPYTLKSTDPGSSGMTVNPHSAEAAIDLDRFADIRPYHDEEVEAVLALINRVKARGVAVVLVTHRMQDLFRVCDRIAVMYEGTKVAERLTPDTNLQELVDLIVGKGGH